MDAAERKAILEAPLRLFWRFDAEPREIAAHAYLTFERDHAKLLHLVHSPATTPLMLAVADEWELAHPPATPLEELRRKTDWYVPANREWSLHVDAGALESLLCNRPLEHEQLSGPDVKDSLRGFPETFLRAPVLAWVRQGVGDVMWPKMLDASVLRPRFYFARDASSVVVTACRYGSAFRDSGQDRTAAVWLSRNAGETFTELPWKLPLRQRLTARGMFCFPPEQIDRVELDRAERPVIEWEDPWIAFEPGEEWRATFVAERRHWLMRARKGIWSS